MWVNPIFRAVLFEKKKKKKTLKVMNLYWTFNLFSAVNWPSNIRSHNYLPTFDKQDGYQNVIFFNFFCFKPVTKIFTYMCARLFLYEELAKKKLSSLTQNLVSDSSPPPSPSSRISTLLRIRPIQTNKQTNTLISIGCIITAALYSPLRPCETSKILKILKNLEYQGNN